MPKKDSEKIIDSYIGMDDPLKVYTLIHYGFRKHGFAEDKAHEYARFCQAVYKELKDQHDVIDSLHKIASVNRLIPNAIALDLAKSTAALKNYRLSAGAGVAGPVVDRLVVIGRKKGIKFNECSLGLTKVALDIAGVGTGTVTSVGLVGIPLLLVSVVATFNDAYGLAKACGA